jgi:hypothetical protein
MRRPAEDCFLLPLPLPLPPLPPRPLSQALGWPPAAGCRLPHILPQGEARRQAWGAARRRGRGRWGPLVLPAESLCSHNLGNIH